MTEERKAPKFEELVKRFQEKVVAISKRLPRGDHVLAYGKGNPEDRIAVENQEAVYENRQKGILRRRITGAYKGRHGKRRYKIL